jgi:hypothetical protein
MNCPHCQKELPENHSVESCPFCGQNAPPQKIDGVGPGETLLAPVKFRAVVFFLVLLGPPILTMISARLIHAQDQSISVGIGLFGGGAAGIACGIMLGLRLGSTLPARIALCLLFVAVMTFVCIMLCFIGCSLGGYQLKID